MSEARLSAVVVSLLTGVGIVIVMGNAFRDFWMGVYIAAPIAAVMALVLSLFASDGEKKKSGGKPHKE